MSRFIEIRYVGYVVINLADETQYYSEVFGLKKLSKLLIYNSYILFGAA